MTHGGESLKKKISGRRAHKKAREKFNKQRRGLGAHARQSPQRLGDVPTTETTPSGTCTTDSLPPLEQLPLSTALQETRDPSTLPANTSCSTITIPSTTPPAAAAILGEMSFPPFVCRDISASNTRIPGRESFAFYARVSGSTDAPGIAVFFHNDTFAEFRGRFMERFKLVAVTSMMFCIESWSLRINLGNVTMAEYQWMMVLKRMLEWRGEGEMIYVGS